MPSLAPRCCALFPQASPARGPRHRVTCSCALSVDASMELLGLVSIEDKISLRSAYYQRMKELHPDVNPTTDTTEDAAAINAAYTVLVEVLEKGDTRQTRFATDAFGRCISPPDRLFVNPFACRVDPFMWRELQAVALSNREAPEDALLRERVAAPPGSISYLTAEQLAAAEALLEEMEQTMAFEVSSWLLADALLRASRSNGFRSR